jgi:hypothetical protein
MQVMGPELRSQTRTLGAPNGLLGQGSSIRSGPNRSTQPGQVGRNYPCQQFGQEDEFGDDPLERGAFRREFKTDGGPEVLIILVARCGVPNGIRSGEVFGIRIAYWSFPFSLLRSRGAGDQEPPNGDRPDQR